MNDLQVQRAGEWISRARRCLVVCHVRPDGDAIGSLLGLGLALRDAGKHVQMISEDGVPAAFRSLVGAETVLRKPDGESDLAIVVDTSEAERAGAVLNELGQAHICIDHHVTNMGFAHLNLIDPQAAATAEMLALLLKRWGFAVTGPIAEALLTGIITDTIGFRTSSVTPQVMRLAAELMETGANLPELYRRALVDRSFEAARLWAAGLTHLERAGRLVWATITQEDRRIAQYPGRDDADLINILSAIEGADIAIIFIEQPNGRVKVSWRAQPGYDVSQIAVGFGGGGHPAASGAEITGSLLDVRSTVLEHTRPLLNGGHLVQS